MNHRLPMDAFARILSVRVCECPLSFRRRVVLMAIVIFCTLLFSFEAIRSTTALTLAASGDRGLDRAVALDPSSGALEEQHGLELLRNGDDPAAALRAFRRAVESSPSRAAYWADIASACEALGDFTCAEEVLARALRLAPMWPRLYWLAANYRLRRAQPDAAFPLFRKLLELDPQYAPATFEVCLRVLNDPARIGREALPDGKDSTLRLAYAEFLSAQGEQVAARQAWADAVRPGSRFEFRQAQPYLERLIRSGQIEDAAAAWSDLERLGVIGQPDSSNLVFNGGFELTPVDSGFDWRNTNASYVAVDFAAPAEYRGRRSLRLDFMGTNADFEPVIQWVPVAPHQHYRLTAEAKSEDITSDSGPRLRVLDVDCPKCLDMSSGMAVGTTTWHELSADFTTGSETRLVKISVWRPHSRSFPFEIRGHFWLDAVSLRAQPPVTVASLKP